LAKVKIVLIYAVGWVGLVILAILNGALREKVYGRFLGELAAHQLSTLIGLGLFTAYFWVLTGVCRMASPGQALVIGALWLFLTILFEFGFGHYVMGHPWRRLRRDYNLLKGRLWLLVLIWTAVAPYVFYRIRS
jgi:hypothetical protein